MEKVELTFFFPFSSSSSSAVCSLGKKISFISTFESKNRSTTPATTGFPVLLPGSLIIIN